MYQNFRNDVIGRLSSVVDLDSIGAIIKVIDMVASDYTITKSSTQIAVVGRRQLLDAIKLYFLIKHQQGMSNTSISTQGCILNRFAMNCTIPMDKITSNYIRAYLYHYQEQHGTSQRTMQTYRTVICAFFRWLFAQGYIHSDVTSVIHKFTFVTKPRKALSQVQLQDVRAICENPTETALVQVLYSTGCRISELINIRQRDIDWSSKQVSVLGKGNKVRTVYINAKAEKSLHRYLDYRGHRGTEWLMVNNRSHNKMSKQCAERIFRKLRDRLGLGKGQLVPHTMRHTMATQAATLCPIQQVQAMLGHSSINTTMIYAQTNADQVRTGHRLAVI